MPTAWTKPKGGKEASQVDTPAEDADRLDTAAPIEAEGAADHRRRSHGQKPTADPFGMMRPRKPPAEDADRLDTADHRRRSHGQEPTAFCLIMGSIDFSILPPHVKSKNTPIL